MKTEGSEPIGMRFPRQRAERLRRMAKSHGWTPSEASARLVEEALRREDFAFIDFRDSSAGRQAYLQSSSLAVWEVAALARSFGNDAAAVAKHLRWPEVKVLAALNYAKAFLEEIETAMAANDAVDFEALSQMLPQAKEFIASIPERA
ncbi:MAG TPA: hypothetical protein PLV87_12850 [Opitutaceae bacterium]|nr:hypothetical protein [Opitutaceae bacterium]